MGLLVDDLLSYSHVSAKPHAKETIDLNEKVSKVLDDLELQVQQKNASINIGALPVVRGYRRQLQQLFQNLISNALKYNKPGAAPVVDITSSTVQGSALGFAPGNNSSDTYHLIEIKDNGIGFEQNDAERIFRMFHRLHSNGEYGGTGVGLSIVRKVADNHNGKVIAESEPGKGATFRIYLPV